MPILGTRRRLLLAGGLAGCGLGSRAAERPQAEIHIGSSAALSGPAAALGQRFHAGAQACFKQLNQKGGIAGARLVSHLLDDAYEPARSEQNTRKLVEDPRVLALFGYVGTPTSHAALPFVRRWKIPFVGPFTGADVLWEPNPLVFNVRASYRAEALLLAADMQAQGIKRVGVLYQADLFGRAGMEALRDAGQPLGLQIGPTAQVQRNSDQVQSSLASLLAQPRPEAIFMVSTYASSAAFIKQARQLGYQGRFYSLSFVGLEPLREALGRDLSKLTVAQVVPDPADRTIPVVAAYQKAMRELGGKQLGAISLEGYLAARVLCEGLRNCRPPWTRASLAEGLATLGHLDLGGFHVDYGPQRHAGSSYIGLRSEP
ncbi:ABC-type branched-subunit amino acid transport system substrate-binding protein [Paucibacter oligotrophus]|uniref:ABC-type branched-subunit amino acid transport system substrate-binding protein n=1 Tax=Roseateles oligotrophus TaxID=1769250 RepID=A0A840L3Q7_9BURK|nr:ABC transporter substrate-binding protein [Roseateles oligotrophus]MBB4842441.1 ABC-type branched-subunit amino acid transport system substrate-binding protein [Roseateles oligotrophus]